MDILFLSKTPLFNGITVEEIAGMLACLDAHERPYKKNAIIYHAGDKVQSMGLVLSGGVNLESFDFDGRKSILGSVQPGQLFAETYACIPDEPLMVNVTASVQSDILFLNAQRMFTMCKNACAYHTKLIRNLLSISAQKNLSLSHRILHTSPRTIRERVEAYLSFQSQREGSRSFSIPFDRQQFADYLNVDRSALSHELGKMEEEGLIKAVKNQFTLLN